MAGGGGGKIAPRSKAVDPLPRAFRNFSTSIKHRFGALGGKAPSFIRSIRDCFGGYQMAREKVGSDMGQFRFPDGTFGRIEALGHVRPDFIREAVLGRLAFCEGGGDREVPVAALPAGSAVRNAGSVRPVVPVRPVARRPGKRDWSGDYERVLGVVRERLRSSRELASDLGWAETRVEAVVSAMELEGLVRFERGGVVAV